MKLFIFEMIIAAHLRVFSHFVMDRLAVLILLMHLAISSLKLAIAIIKPDIDSFFRIRFGMSAWVSSPQNYVDSFRFAAADSIDYYELFLFT